MARCHFEEWFKVIGELTDQVFPSLICSINSIVRAASHLLVPMYLKKRLTSFLTDSYIICSTQRTRNKSINGSFCSSILLVSIYLIPIMCQAMGILNN